MTWRDKEIAICLSKIQTYRHKIHQLCQDRFLATDVCREQYLASLQGALLRQEARLRKLDPDGLLD